MRCHEVCLPCVTWSRNICHIWWNRSDFPDCLTCVSMVVLCFLFFVLFDVFFVCLLVLHLAELLSQSEQLPSSLGGSFFDSSFILVWLCLQRRAGEQWKSSSRGADWFCCWKTNRCCFNLSKRFYSLTCRLSAGTVLLSLSVLLVWAGTKRSLYMGCFLHPCFVLFLLRPDWKTRLSSWPLQIIGLYFSVMLAAL